MDGRNGVRLAQESPGGTATIRLVSNITRYNGNYLFSPCHLKDSQMTTVHVLTI